MKKSRFIPTRSFVLIGLTLATLATLTALYACSPETPPATQTGTSQPSSSVAKALEVTLVTDDEADKTAASISQQVNLVAADGLEAQLWASEKLLADPVAISVDNRGRVWVAVTNRSNNSEFDIRGYPAWEAPSVGFRSVEDRRQFLRTELAPEKSQQNTWLQDRNKDGSHDWRDLAVEKEEVVIVEDTTGNGRADRSQVFLRDFGDEVTDVLGGIEYHNHRDEVFLAVGPGAWQAKDTNGDGAADSTTSLADGFSIHIGFSGHGMSGMTVGPDGRIYYGIGDIGMSHTDANGKRWHYPDQGVIVRSEPDGSNFEVFARGLRNTHEFTFDKYGNLITVDNDGDHEGEYERLTYLIDGSDSGWRINWQLGKYKDPKNNLYKVWMDEGFYKPRFEGQAAHLLPPLAPYHSGPAGMVYNPGTALGEEWQDHFFVVEFVGSAPRSGINAFTLEPDGASFTLASDKQVFRGVQGTGLDFGPDGALYMSDWIEGWGRNGKGRIWKLDKPAETGSQQRQDTQAILAEDFGPRSAEQLLPLLQHQDMRVRQKAQFELAERKAVPTLLAAIQQGDHQLARIHGMWGLGQLARQDKTQAEPLVVLLTDKDPEIRAQAARLLGDIAYADATAPLIAALSDENPRTIFFAAQALGRIGTNTAISPLVAMLEKNNDRDIYLRQAGAIALERIGDETALAQLADHKTEAVRVAAVVALRRLQSPQLERFLNDKSEFIVTDAARAISDDDFIEPALPALARMLGQTRINNEPLMRRAINANLYVGQAEGATRLVSFAQDTKADGKLRAEAIQALGVWGESSAFDRVTGQYRGVINNNAGDARTALTSAYSRLLVDRSAEVREAMVLTLGGLGFTDALAQLSQVMQQDNSAKVRIAALNTLKALKYPAMREAVFSAMKDRDQDVRMAALSLLPTLDLPVTDVVEIHRILLDTGSIGEQQAAYISLANVDKPEAHQVLVQKVQALIAGEIDPAVQLELITAAEKAATAELKTLLADYEGRKDPNNPLDKYREALLGGDAMAGQNLFRYNTAGQCVRCHMVGHRGNLVGPALTDIANTLSREQLLEALVAPGARIAPGFGRITAVLATGDRIEGFFEAETATDITLVATDKTHQLAKTGITRVEPGVSGMPPMGYLLDRAQLRDLVAYLVTLTGEEEEEEKH